MKSLQFQILALFLLIVSAGAVAQSLIATDSAKLAGRTPTTAGLDLIDDADAAAQRTTLGLGTIATQAANSVAITGGSIAGITDLAVADGGTGASTASQARANLKVGTVAAVTNQGANNTTVETDLATYTLPGGTLAATGDSIWFEASGTCANNINSKTIKVRFGSGMNTQVASTTGTMNTNAIQWYVRGRVIRTGSATQKGNALFGTSAFTTGGHCVTNLNHTLANDADIRVTGQSGTASNDILLESFFVGIDPAP